MKILLIASLCCEAVAVLLSLLISDLNLKALDETRDYGGLVIGKTGAAAAIKDHVRGAPDHTPAAKEITE
jgi:hypothetical protein